MLRLKDKYIKEIVPLLQEKFGFKNKMAIPKIIKVVVNTGFGKLIANKSSDEQKKIYEAIVNDLSLICGQKPIITKIKKSIAGFKIRKGMPVGSCVVLRGEKAYDFLEKLINLILPRSRDFQGIKPQSVDQKGNLTIGLKEHIVFPEISPEKVKNIFGLEITISTTAKNKEQGIELLKLLGFPFKKD